MPIIVDPLTYDKATAFDDAVALCREFLDLNGLPHPEYIPTQGPIEGRWKDFGLYIDDGMRQRVWVNLKKSRPPTRTPGFSWSYTGSKADLTVPGITAHETGHHVQRVLGVRASNKVVKNAIKGEASVSGYEPHAGESFAEAMRLFILNPALLFEGRPRRWNLIEGLGLRPMHFTPWRDVLVNAHPRIISAVEGWIRR